MKITVRLANAPDVDGHYIGHVYITTNDGGYNDGTPQHSRTFVGYEREAVLADAQQYAAWLRDHDDSEQEIEL